MKRPKKYEQMPVPRLDRQVKAMNGKSTKRLEDSIELLSDLLDETEEVQSEEATDEPSDLRDAE
jgi:hypothetical protein